VRPIVECLEEGLLPSSFDAFLNNPLRLEREGIRSIEVAGEIPWSLGSRALPLAEPPEIPDMFMPASKNELVDEEKFLKMARASA
jgi:hypothetical protein